MKQRKVAAGVIVVVVIAIAAAVIIYMQTSGKESKMQKDLELASQYLDELDYEQAIAVYEEILSIDPKNQEALVGGAKAYTRLAEQQEDANQAIQDIEQAVAYAEQVYGLYPEEIAVQEVLADTCIWAGDFYMNAARYEKAIDCYERIVSLELDESLQEKQKIVEEKISEAKKVLEKAEMEQTSETLLRPVLEAWQNGDMEEVKRLIRQDEYNQMAETLGDGESYYYGEYDESGERSGVGVGVYKVHDFYEGDIPFYYIGEWKGGVREGQADWIYGRDVWGRKGGAYRCEWINDFPEGEVFCIYDSDTVRPERDEVIYTYTKGNVTHGLYNVNTFSFIDREEELITLTLTYNKGYINVLYADNETPEAPYVVVEFTDEGDHWVQSYSETGINITYGIPGFGEALE